MNNKQYELIGESIWNTYRSLGALIEARLDSLSLASRRAADTRATQATNTKTYKKQVRARRKARNAAITPEGITNYLAEPGRPDRKRWGRVRPEGKIRKSK